MATNPARNDGSYKDAQAQLSAAVDAYRNNPSVVNLIAVYQAQNAVRAAATGAAEKIAQTTNVDPNSVRKTIAQLQDPSNEPVPGTGIALAQALIDKLRAQSQSGQPQSIEQARGLAEAQRQLEDYIDQATAKIQDDDSHFADEYMRLTGQPPAPGQFSSAQTINGVTPTPQPSPGQGTEAPGEKTVGAVKHFAPSGLVSQVPDEGLRPPGVKPAVKPRAPKTPKPKYDNYNNFVDVNPLPSWAPSDIEDEYRTSGLDAASSDSVQSANDAIRRSKNLGLVQAGSYGPNGRMNENATKSGNLVFVGYNVSRQKIVGEPEEYQTYGPQIVTSRTPAYQNKQALKYAFGLGGMPTIAEFQKTMGLPVTGAMTPDTEKYWDIVVNTAAYNTAVGLNMTIQDTMASLMKAQRLAASQARAAMAAAFNVDPTASAAILGSAMKQITGRLSTAGEDAEFHRAFNSANISTQGKVDAQQFARDWVRGKYPTEAGTMAGQDYYGAMFDVLTSGPGSLGSEAANIGG